MIQALETLQLGKRYGGTWALRNCSLQIPVGRIVGLVGPNGAGKTTLLHLIMGLLTPSSGSISVLGNEPGKQQKNLLPKVGFVAQDRPLYKTFTVSDMLTFGRKLNAQWDNDLAMKRLNQLGIPLNRPTGKLSGGQQAQVALVLALAKRPEFLILDEPVASLDPLARREFQKTLMGAVAEDGMTVLLSSHIVADLQRLCDYLIILSASQVQLAGDIERLLQSHKLLVGPCEQVASVAKIHTILLSSSAERQCTLLVKAQATVFNPLWKVQEVSLEDMILAYLSQSNMEKQEQKDQEMEITL